MLPEQAALRVHWSAMAWPPEPTYQKPAISARSTTLCSQIVAPMRLPFSGGLLKSFRCRKGKCFFRCSHEHPPTGTELDDRVQFGPIAQTNRTISLSRKHRGDRRLCKSADRRVSGWRRRASAIETPAPAPESGRFAGRLDELRGIDRSNGLVAEVEQLLKTRQERSAQSWRPRGASLDSGDRLRPLPRFLHRVQFADQRVDAAR